MAVARTGGFTDEIALGLVRHFESAGVPCTPSALALALVRDKAAVGELLLARGLPTPPMVRVDHAEYSTEAAERFGFPLVVKARGGMRGQGVALARSADELATAVDAVGGPVVEPIVQPFVGDGSGGDVRVMVVGGRCLGAIRRTPVGAEFRANAHHGATVAPYPLDPELARLAVAATEAVGLHFAGCDLIRHHDGWCIIEVNSAPGFEAFESATGVDVAGPIVDAALLAAGA